jgi:hypothetical protein
MPPSTRQLDAVMNEASSLARKATAIAISAVADGQRHPPHLRGGCHEPCSLASNGTFARKGDFRDVPWLDGAPMYGAPDSVWYEDLELEPFNSRKLSHHEIFL